MKKFLFVITILGMLASCIVASFTGRGVVPSPSGRLTELGPMATLYGIQQARIGASGTFLMESEKLILAAWPSKSCWGFVAFQKTGVPVFDLLKSIGWGGQKTDSVTFTSFVKALETSGKWNYVTADKLPVAVITAMSRYTIMELQTGSSTLISVLVVPISVGQYKELLYGLKEVQ